MLSNALRSFVAELGSSASSIAVFEAIIMLGTALDFAITAEGIETEHQLRTLSRLGCPAGQGFLLAEPMSPDEIPRWLLAVHAGADKPALYGRLGAAGAMMVRCSAGSGE